MSNFFSLTSLRNPAPRSASIARPDSAARPAEKDRQASSAMLSDSESVEPPADGSTAKQDWERSLKQAASLQPNHSYEVTKPEDVRKKLEAIADRLRNRIEQMRHRHAGLSRTAGEMEFHQHLQINLLMSMIASLTKTLHQNPSEELPDYRQLSRYMRSLEGDLYRQRGQKSSDRCSAENSLYSMRSEQAALERELVFIRQQLSALHTQLTSLGAI